MQTLPSADRLAKDIRKLAAHGAGEPYRGPNTVTPDLELVAAEIVADTTLESHALCGEAVKLAAFRLGDGPYAEAVRTAFRISEESKYFKELKARRRLAAEKLRNSSIPIEESELDHMSERLAAAMLRLVAEERERKGGSKVKLQTHARRGWPAVLAGAVAVGGLLIVAALWITHPQSSPSSSATLLQRLAGEAGRGLKLAQTPPPGSESKTLGYGDSYGGRPAYPYSERSSMPARPILNSLYDVPDGMDTSFRGPSGPNNIPRDEREFLTVAANAPNAPTIRTEAWGHSARLRWPGYLAVGIYIADSAWPGGRECETPPERLYATNVRVRVTIWNSPDSRLHVIRAWIEAGNPTFPTWVTDAAAVVTERPARLVLNPRFSLQGRYLKAEQYLFHPRALKSLSGDAIMWPRGMQLGNNGLLGPCTRGRRYISLAFSQKAT